MNSVAINYFFQKQKAWSSWQVVLLTNVGRLTVQKIEKMCESDMKLTINTVGP